jgi:hypothetical protein
MSTPAIIAVTPGSGVLLDAVSLVVGGQTVVRETMVLADPTNPTALAGVTPAGALKVDNTGTAASYAAYQSAFIPLADPVLPFFILRGSASKIIRLRKIRVSWAAVTGNSAPNILHAGRYTAISGGTPITVVSTRKDTTSPIATAVASQYSAFPSASLLEGFLFGDYMQWTTNAAGVAGPTILEFDFGVDGMQPLTLRGVNESLGLGITALAASGGLMSVGIFWTEE